MALRNAVGFQTFSGCRLAALGTFPWGGPVPPRSYLLSAMSIEAVRQYYQECHFDYRVVWRLEQNLSIHFGYFDEECQEHAAALENMNRAMLSRTSISESDRVLDAGCGVGGSSFWIAEQTGANVTGVNIQPLHLELARAECIRRSLAGQVSFEER